MRTRVLPTIACGLFLLAAYGCAVREPVSEIDAHPRAWATKGDIDFHGEKVERDGVATCTGCHGADLQGSGKATSCYECHDGPGGHPSGWARRPNPPHAAAVALEGNDDCQYCHGADYLGGWSAVSCYTCHAGGPSGHADGWVNRLSSSFHGRFVSLNGSVSCTACHGGDLRGGTSGVACADCHS
jgi:hypothetical protein